MLPLRILFFIGFTEMVMGAGTLAATAISLFFFFNTKPLNVLVFVLATSLLSTLLGIGLLYYKKIARDLLIYFSSVVMISKLLIFADIIQLNGALETTIPEGLKNILSFFYHAFVLLYLSGPEGRKFFKKRLHDAQEVL